MAQSLQEQKAGMQPDAPWELYRESSENVPGIEAATPSLRPIRDPVTAAALELLRGEEEEKQLSPRAQATMTALAQRFQRAATIGRPVEASTAFANFPVAVSAAEPVTTDQPVEVPTEITTPAEMFSQNKQNLVTKSLRSGSIITIVPRLPQCGGSFQLDAIITSVQDAPQIANATRMFNINFFHPTCPPRVDPSNQIPLLYWLVQFTDGSFVVYPSRYTPGVPNQKLELLEGPQWTIQVHTVIPHMYEQKYKTPGGVIAGDVRAAPGVYDEVRWGDNRIISPNLSYIAPSDLRKTLTVRMADGSTVTTSDSREGAILQRQQDLLKATKPPLLRTMPNARNRGLGIRELQPEEFRREWLLYKEGMFVIARVDVTDGDEKYITSINVSGRIRKRYDKSPLLNYLGVVYELDNIEITGDSRDIYLYTPESIGARKIKYWICVYYDLQDSKIVAASDLTTYELLLTPRGTDFRLAEYAVGDLKLKQQPVVATQVASVPSVVATPVAPTPPPPTSSEPTPTPASLEIEGAGETASPPTTQRRVKFSAPEVTLKRPAIRQRIQQMYKRDNDKE